MKFLMNNWYRLTFVAFIAMAFWAIFFGGELSLVQKLLLASLMALPLHQFEEYQLPGGGPVVINRYFYGRKEGWQNYPGNWLSVAVINLSAYVFYILALAFPQLTWLGMATMFFNLYQVLGHCLQMNLKMGTWYNPGMLSSVALFLPISVAYIACTVSGGLVAGMDWLFAVLAFFAMAALSVVAPVQLMKREDSPYAIPEWQAQQLEKVRNRCSLRRE